MSDFKDFKEIEDATMADYLPLIVGHTIVAFERSANSGESWPDGANDVRITLDDGSRLWFSGWGYDASGLNTYFAKPPEALQPEPSTAEPDHVPNLDAGFVLVDSAPGGSGRSQGDAKT